MSSQSNKMHMFSYIFEYYLSVATTTDYVKHHNTNIKGSDQHSDPDNRKYVHKQAKMKSQRNVTYNKKIRNKKIKKHNPYHMFFILYIIEYHCYFWTLKISDCE